MRRVLTVVPFETEPNHHYLYDDNTGMIFPSSPAVQDLLVAHRDAPLDQAVASLAGRHAPDALEAAADFIGRWESRFGAFYRTTEYRDAVKQNMTAFGRGDVEALISEHAWVQLVLTLTENCNLRCSYCYFSEAYSLSRNRTAKTLSVEMGKKALDYFFANAAPKIAANPMRKLAITFYGGEPLMAQRTLRELTAYARANAPAELILALTTNGTMLRGEIADFLVENNFYVLVSLDGGREDHDRNRVFPNGGGSFDRIVENLRAFRERHPDFKRIHHIAVFDYGTDLQRVNQFHAENEDWLPPLQMTSQANEFDTDYYEQFSEEDVARFREAHSQLEKTYVHARMNGEQIPTFARVYFETRLLGAMLRKRQGNLPFAIMPFTNTCVPGSKLTVRTDGTFDICERVNGTMPIGSVDAGLDLDAVGNIIRTYNEQICGGCWACPVSKLCGHCFASCNADGRFEKNENCRETVENIRTTLSNVHRVLEKHPDAFSDLSYFNPELRLLTR
ncbi:MAG TPA: radical SAM protein [Thermoanaerobaculia bacterium]|nr:radical SAM protein [Thermoanaerobaculia bacterium]